MTVLTTNQKLVKPMQPCLLKKLTKIYSTPTPMGGAGAKKVKVLVLIDVWMSTIIAGVQYLYPRLDYESWSNKTGYKTLVNKTKLSKL